MKTSEPRQQGEKRTGMSPEPAGAAVDAKPQPDGEVGRFPIVGIGASAGGLEAIEAFFETVPLDSGMAFVVVQHLSPDYKSLMVELLSRKTDIPVQRAEEGMWVEANNIYLIPPKKTLTIFHRQLLLEDKKQHESINLPVDIFLRSLADDQCERAVAVILSGTGSDGTRGVRAIKESGGLVMIQDEESAKFDGMPRAAAATGLADFILPPQEMSAQLLACLRHPYATPQKRQQESRVEEKGLTRLFSLLRAKTKVDFTYYKPSTITRRIERRIAITQSQDLDDYVRYAGHTPAEVSALYRELLIGVTSFFRDPNVWAILREQVLPKLFKESNKRELRFWVAGCSTGEEAYTLAIVCREVLDEVGLACDIKIFATDVDSDAITKAGVGLYPESITADLTPTLLVKYFHRRGDDYQVSRSLREMVVFAQHNLVKDPPFTRIDMVSCRNLLIYLQSNLQRRALEMFAFSLRFGGIFLQGTSETVGDMDVAFEAIDRKACIFKSLGKTPVRTTSDGLDVLQYGERKLPMANSFARGSRVSERGQDRLITRLLDSLSDSYAPLAVVVNEQLEIQHTLGNPGDVFRVPTGRAVYDISKMVARELAIPLATGIQKVLRSGKELTYSNIRLHEGETTRKIRLRMRPLPGRQNDETMVVVFFEDIEEKRTDKGEMPDEYDLNAETVQRLQDLEQDLQFTRENLQATIEELETSNEELQATNEELLSSNEELQSTNEELQSTNEELYTVNSEYQNKIIELTEARNDIENLLSSSRIGTLILDEDMHIRHYSPQIAVVFNLVESDIGRPLQHLSQNLRDLNPLDMARESQQQDRTIENEARDEEGHWYLVRAMPYRVGNQMVAGVVITLIEITEQKLALESRRESEEKLIQLSRAVEQSVSTIVITDLDGNIEYANPQFEKTTGYKVEEAIGHNPRILKSDNMKSEDFKELWETILSGKEWRGNFHNKRKDGTTYWESASISPIRDTTGKITHFLAVKEDITERVDSEIEWKRNQAQQRRQRDLLDTAEKIAQIGSWTWDPAADRMTWSKNLYQLLQRDPELGAPNFSEYGTHFAPESLAQLQQAVQDARENGKSSEIKLKAVRSDGSTMSCIASVKTDGSEAGRGRQLYGSLQEI